MTSGADNRSSSQELDDAVYLIFNSDEKSDVQKIPIKDIALVDIREKERDNRILSVMLITTIVCGVLVACELAFDVVWIADGVLEVLCGLCMAFLTSSFWYAFIKRYEVMITFSSGIKRLLH
ncbi:MAG: hypothetical protein WCO00_00240 [Rhodospirillaceae bacterium]